MKQMSRKIKKNLNGLQCTRRNKREKILMSLFDCNVVDLLNNASIRLERERWLKWERVRVSQNGRRYKKRLGYKTFCKTIDWAKKYLKNNCFYFLFKKESYFNILLYMNLRDPQRQQDSCTDLTYPYTLSHSPISILILILYI